MTRSITRLALGITVSLACGSNAYANNDTWDTAASGIWGTGANWLDNTTPGNSDTATFDLAGTYTATVNAAPAEIQGLTVSAGAVTLTSSGGQRKIVINSGGQDLLVHGSNTTLTLGTSPSNALNLIVGDDLRIRGGGIMRANFGSDIITTDLFLGDSAFPPGDGTLYIDGIGSLLTVSESTQLGTGGRIGALVVANGATADFNGTLGLADDASFHFSRGLLIVQSGAAITTANIRIGAHAINGHQGALTVDGGSVGTSMVTQDANATLIVGAALGGPNPNSGTLNVYSGGVFHSGSGTGTITVNPTGVINITGIEGGTLNANGNVTINGGKIFRTNGELNLAPGKTMTIQNGGLFDVTGGYSAENATYIVTGPGSTWTNSAELSVGYQGTGSLTISAGGAVSNTFGSIGTLITSNGAVTVTGAGSTWTNSSFLDVGDERIGTLTISAGGVVANTFGTIGRSIGGNGDVTVIGAGSTWANSGELLVGDEGIGRLTIEAGGAVSNTIGRVGIAAGSDGAVIVSGSGSTWTNSAELYVGDEGIGKLTIEDGGVVSYTFGAVGNSAGSDGAVTVTGAGSAWTNSSSLHVGHAGTGTLTIEDGGDVSNAFGTIGTLINSNGAVTVTGAGSTWTNNFALVVGEQGTGSLTISNGGAVSNTFGYVGFVAGSDGAVTVTGAGSTWTNTIELYVGGDDVMATGAGMLTIAAGGLAQASGNTIVWANGAIDIQAGGRFNANGTNGDVTIDDGVLTRASSGTFALAAGKTMTVQNGGTASFSGSYATASNATYDITGVGSRLETVAGGTLSIINGAEVNVSSGGSLFAATTIQVGFSNGTDGTLIVDGPGSSATTPGAGSAIWGFGGATADVTFRQDASGSFSQVSVAHSTTAGTTGIVTIESGAHLTLTSNLALAALGGATTSATLSVQGSGLSGSTVTQTGGSSLTVGHSATGTAAINIGTTSSGAVFDTGTGTMNINKTGTVTIGSGGIEFTTGTLNADGNVNINGGVLTRSSLSTFNLAEGKTMTIQNGGRATFTGNYITAGGTHTITGAGSKLETPSGSISIKDGITVNVQSGGLLSAFLSLFVGDTTTGTLSVDGTGSFSAVAAFNSSWGFNGGTANVTFSNAASGTFNSLDLASSSTSGNTANVTVQSGAVLTTRFLGVAAAGGANNSATLDVQGSGSSVTQTVSFGAMDVGHELTGTAAINIGTASGGSGAILATSTDGFFRIQKTGTVTVGSGGNTGELYANGDVTINGGLLQVGSGSSVIVAAGKTMTLVNDGTVQGSGNVAGNVVNTSGNIEPGNSPGELAINGNYTQSAAGKLAIELAGTTPGSEYDRLLVSGTATLAGILEVSLLSFMPQLNDQFDILDWSALSGTFDTLDLPALMPGRIWDTSQLYSLGVLSVAPALLGDFNLDGSVDAADYVVWRKNPGGIYTQDDFNTWRANFGTTPGSGAGAAANATVPEPTTLLMLIIAAAGWCVRRGRAAEKVPSSR